MNLPSEQELKCIKYAEKFYNRSFISSLLKRKDYNVDDSGSFSRLWSNYGLRDYGSNFNHRGPFQKSDKIKCLEFWIISLYNKNINIGTWLSEIDNELKNQAKLYYQKNPGVHIQMQKAEDLIIDKIDERLGRYK